MENNTPVPDLSEPRAEKYPLAPNPQSAPLTIADNPDYPFLGVETKRGPEPVEVEYHAESVPANLPVHAGPVLKVVNKPEPVEEPVDVEPVVTMDAETILKVSVDPAIAEALAAEGLKIDQDEVNRALEENKRRNELEAALDPATSAADLQKAFVDEPRDEDLEPVTPEAFRDVKMGINSSFEEVASLLLEHQRQIDEIEARLEAHNRRGGHKI